MLSFVAGAPDELDPIRIMKGLFIFCQEAPEGWLPKADRYHFRPHLWGPFSREIYRDLEALEKAELVAAVGTAEQGWKSYAATAKGVQMAQSSGFGISPEATAYLRRVRQFTTSVTFQELLRAVYKNYPQFATASLFRS